ncbi:hypothetical protein GCM10011290_12590 [Vogesella alkaliphila]|nr:hypothetical protein GCM10011290_12590 [Vogesella alkaliphila]
MPFCSSTRITPTWAKPLAAPPPSASAIFGFGAGFGTETGGVGVVHAANKKIAALAAILDTDHMGKALTAWVGNG